MDVGIQPEDHSGQNKMICIRQARTFSFYVLAIYLKYNYVQHSKRTDQIQDSEMHNLIACMETRACENSPQSPRPIIDMIIMS